MPMNAKKRTISALVIVAFVALLSVFSSSGQNSEHAQKSRFGAGTDWPVYGGAPEGTRYSSLRQINRQNVRNLKVAWTFESGDAYAGSEMQCNPLVVGGVLYATTPKVNVTALNAA